MYSKYMCSKRNRICEFIQACMYAYISKSLFTVVVAQIALYRYVCVNMCVFYERFLFTPSDRCVGAKQMSCY